MSALRLGAIMPADLDHTLEVDIHAIGELEGLEVGEADDGRARTEVLNLLEPAGKNVDSYSFPPSKHISVDVSRYIPYVLYRI